MVLLAQLLIAYSINEFTRGHRKFNVLKIEKNISIQDGLAIVINNNQPVTRSTCNMPKVAILTFDHVALFELACVVEVFAMPQPEQQNWYQTEVVCFEDTSLESSADIRLGVTRIENLSAYDMLVIPSWSTVNNHVRLNMAEQISEFAMRQGRILAIGSGAFLLAQLGLLQNKKATTHWQYKEAFKHRFPLVEYIENALFTHDQNFSCAAGSSAALDLVIDILRQDFGAEVANQVARRLLIAPHREGGQGQFVETVGTENTGQLASTIEWAKANLDSQLMVEDLVSNAKMSRRSFDRHFKVDFGTSPKVWLNQQRIERAKRLLESQDISIEQLAKEVGYENSITLRFNFNKYVGVSPSLYQSQFKLKR